MGSLQRSSWGQFPEYHTSADNLDFIRPEHLASSRRLVDEIIQVLETNRAFRNLKPYGEPALGKYGLFDVRHATAREAEAYRMALLWVLNLSDGDWDLASIAARAKLPYRAIREAADRLMQVRLLEPVDPASM